MSDNPNESDTMNISQVAEYLQITRNTVYRWIESDPPKLAPLPQEKPYLKRQPVLFRREDVERLKNGG